MSRLARALGPSPAYKRRRRLFAALLLVALAGLLVVAAGASADALTPESGGSPNADRIDSLYKVILVIAAIVFVGVEGALIYSLVKFRARRGRVAAQIRGNTNLELGWTVGAALILVVLVVFTFTQLGGIKNPPASGADGLTAGRTLYASVDQPRPPAGAGKPLHILVNGQQYIWRFTYQTTPYVLTDPYAYTDMYVPVNTTVLLDISAQDVAHSWWIPQLGGKFDGIPGARMNHTWFKASKVGAVYRGQCAELCGRNHANMTASVHVLSVPGFKAWLARQRAYINQANTIIQKQRASGVGPGTGLVNPARGSGSSAPQSGPTTQPRG